MRNMKKLLPILQLIARPKPARELRLWVCSRLKAQAPVGAERQRRPTVAFGNLPLTGQALAELAILGSLLILALGSLVSYSLRYNQQQDLSQEAFRRALGVVDATTSDGNGGEYVKYPSASYTIIEDKHIPDPLNPFAMGAVSPTMASASVTRDWAMHLTPDNKKELPHMRIRVNGKEINCNAVEDDGKGCTTAGWREENDVEATETTIDKYIEIFGNTVEGCKGVDKDNKCTGGWDNIYDDDDGDRFIREEFQDGCVKWETNANPETGEEVKTCSKYVIKKIRFIDGSAGEIMNYEGSVRQCRQLVDNKVCKTECEKGRSPDVDEDNSTSCSSLCAEKFNSPNQTKKTYDSDKGGAWYCANYKKDEDGKYVFPVLEEIFSTTNPDGSKSAKEMGLLSSCTQALGGSGNTLNKTEQKDKIITTTTHGWESTITRKMRYVDPNKAKKISIDEDTDYDELVDEIIRTDTDDPEDLVSKHAEDKTTTWTTPK